MIKTFEEILWRFSGADLYYIKKSAAKSQRRFRWIGLGYFGVVSLTLCSLLNAFHHVFGLSIGMILAAVIITFLISNIYRLNILSLEPHTLPYKQEIRNVKASYFFRVIIVSLFAIFISKLFEIMLFHGFIDTDGEQHFMHDLVQLNSDLPLVWIITPLVLILFLFPIFIKYDLRRDQEYFNLKRKTEKDLVLREYERFKSEYNSIFRTLKRDYDLYLDDLEKEFRSKEFIVKDIKYVSWNTVEFKDRKYKDPPFNTVELPDDKCDSQDDFLLEFG